MGRGGVGIFFGTLSIDNILKIPLLTKQNYQKKYFSMSCLFKYYVSILGGGGGSRPMLIMLTQGGVGGLE